MPGHCRMRCTTNLGDSLFSGWDRKYPSTGWLGTLKNMTSIYKQWLPFFSLSVEVERLKVRMFVQSDCIPRFRC